MCMRGLELAALNCGCCVSCGQCAVSVPPQQALAWEVPRLQLALLRGDMKVGWPRSKACGRAVRRLHWQGYPQRLGPRNPSAPGSHPAPPSTPTACQEAGQIIGMVQRALADSSPAAAAQQREQSAEAAPEAPRQQAQPRDMGELKAAAERGDVQALGCSPFLSVGCDARCWQGLAHRLHIGDLHPDAAPLSKPRRHPGHAQMRSIHLLCTRKDQMTQKSHSLDVRSVGGGAAAAEP